VCILPITLLYAGQFTNTLNTIIMKHRYYYLPLIIAVLTFLMTGLSGFWVSAQAQSNVSIGGQEVSVRLGFTVQPRFTYAYEAVNNADAIERIGFGVRRYRMRATTSFGTDFRLFTQLEGSGTNATLIDLRGEYKLNDKVWLRFGRFVGAHPRVMAITLLGDIDHIDRPAIAALWASNTIGGDARDYGLEMMYTTPQLQYRLFLANGHNGTNFRNEPASGSITGNTSNKGMALNAMVSYTPENISGAEFGFHAGVNQSKNPNTISPRAAGVGRGFVTSSAYAYWGARPGDQPIRVKFDVVSVQYDEIRLANGSDYQQLFLGAALMGAYAVRPEFELVATLENYNLDTDNSGSEVRSITLAGSYSFSKARGGAFSTQKMTVGYVLKDQQSRDNPSHMLVVKFQIHI
jgi:hypothetical protein